MTNRVLGAAGLGVLASVGAWKAAGPVVAFIILLLLVLLIGGYLFWQQKKRKRASSQFQSSLGQEAAQAPREVKDPARQADLDKLRKRFMDGIEIYRSRGKDLYSVPWFVIIGESGSGKTEAIRHSNLDFPAGLNDFMQGAGGTINMDWWFTNHGVILDTAGSMLFREVGGDSAASPQWQEFLKLLKKNRSHCPINGLVLVLSVDSLINDSAAKIAEKAGRIARHLDLIQRTLDIRFPVSVLVTKCDKLTGFREFFEPIDDPELQDQMVGWSNPDPLDQPFRPDLMDQHLGQVIQRLRKRRLGLLRDPSPVRGLRARRADEVDALYALPKSLSLIAPRLRRYLEAIFVGGEFSAKPVFVRGIYFTSAMQTGADLDEAVWNALGRPTTAADTTGTSQQDLGRPFFLRHVFLEKVFRERGLVTRATNTKRMLRQRKLMLIGAMSACLLLVLLFGVVGKWKLDKEIRHQSAAWDAAAAGEGWENDNLWHPIVKKPRVDDQWVFRYQGLTDIVGYTNLASFHRELRDSAESRLRVSLIFWPATLFIGRGVETKQREEAQRCVFERSVVLPLISNTRLKMQEQGRVYGTADKEGFQQEALKALIRLQVDNARGTHSLDTNAAVVATNYLFPYLSYLTETNSMRMALDLAEVFLRTYKDAWPPAAKEFRGGDTLATNVAIGRGLDRFFTNAFRANSNQSAQVTDLEKVSRAAAAFETQEKRWHEATRNNNAIEPDYLSSLQTAKSELDAAIAAGQAHGLFTGTNGIESHLTQIKAQNALTGSNAVNEIRLVMTRGTTPLTNALFGEIRSRLDQFLTSLGTNAVMPAPLAAKPGELDANSLRFCDPDKRTRSYELRFLVYTQAYFFRQTTPTDVGSEVGREWAILTNLSGRAAVINSNSGRYLSEYGHAGDLHRTCEHLVKQGETISSSNFVARYANHVADCLRDFDSREQRQVKLAALESASALFTNVQKDLDAAPGRVPDAQRPLLASLPGAIQTAREGLIRKYTANAEADLEANMGFPIWRDGETPLRVEDVSALHSTVARLSNELASTALKTYPGDTPAVAKLNARLNKCLKILPLFIETDNKPSSCTLKVNAADLQPSVFSYCRALAVSEDGQAMAMEISTGSTDLGLFLLSQKLVIVAKRFREPSPGVRTNTLPEWAALRLIADPKYGPKSKPGRKVWDVLLPAGPDVGQTVTVQLNFSQSVPPDSEWPTKADW